MPLEQLRQWGIEYHVVEQQEGDGLILTPWAYRQCWTRHGGVMETGLYGDHFSWLRYGRWEDCFWGCEKTAHTWDDARNRMRRPSAQHPKPKPMTLIWPESHV